MQGINTASDSYDYEVPENPRLPEGAVSFSELLGMAREGHPEALIQLKSVYDAAFLRSLDRPGVLEALALRVALEWERLGGIAPRRPTDPAGVIRMAADILVVRDKIEFGDLLYIPHREIVEQALARRAGPTKRLEPASDSRTAKWYRVATNSKLREQALRQAFKAGRLQRLKRGVYEVEEVCGVWPQYEGEIRDQIDRERREPSRSVEKRRI